jgi:hypothetical protein
VLDRRFLALTAAFLVMAPATSFAASATQDAYSDVSGVDEGQPAPETSDQQPAAKTATAAPTATATSTLPFTGLEAGLIAAAGLGLAGTGIVLRRAARDQG